MANVIGDQLFPVLENDPLEGTSGDDYIYGGGASDTLTGGDGVDSIDGGDGIDWITFDDVTGGVEISLLAVAVPVTPVQIMSIDEGAAGVIGFDTTSTIVNDPTGGTNKVVRVEKGTGALGAAGTTVFLNDANDSVGVVPFTADSTTVTMRVYMETPEAGVRVRMKFENADIVQQTVEADALTTDAEGWQTLTFDFAEAATNNGNPTARLDLDYTFNKVSVFFNFGLSEAQGGGGTFYFDDLNFVKSPDPSGTITNDGFGNTESIANVENVLGSAFGDRITGGDGANDLQGAGGNDTLDGGAGTDTFDGGTGTDTISFSSATSGVELALDAGPLVDFDESTPPLLTDFGPDDVDPNNAGVNVGSIVADPDGGNNQVARFVKGVAAEVWAGVVVSTGPNFSVGALPLTSTDKTMTLRVWTEKANVQVLLKLENAGDSGINTGAFATTSVQGGWETLTFTFGAALPGPNTGEFNPANTYNKAVLFFDFGKNGTEGAGTFYFDDIKVLGTVVGEILDDGFGNTETVVNVENAIGSRFADSLTGDARSNSLSGGDGNDTLSGGAGNDTLNGGNGSDSMTGGTGNDTYYVNTSGDRVVEASGGGSDTVRTTVGFTLSANVEHLILTGTNNSTLTGNSLANKITGNSGNNVIDGGSGADTMTGGAGNDTYYVNTSGDRVVEQAGGGADTISTTISFTLPSEVENLTMTGTGNSTLTGNVLANRITGNSGKNVINGGAGADTMTGGAGNDTYTVDHSGDVIVEVVGGGSDGVSSSVTFTLPTAVERLTLTGSSAINGTGTGLNNTITGNTGTNNLSGGDGNDNLYGMEGVDTLSGGNGNDLLDGGTSADSMIGGAGNDGYIVQNSADKVIEASGGGTDTVVSSSASYTLPAEVEKLALTGTSPLEGHGNSLDNVIVGNSGNNLLRGSTGNDTLTGGAGLDIFRFSSALNASTNVDTLTDFNPADDILQFENSVFIKLTSTGVLSASNFRASTTGNAADSNDYVLYETDTGHLFYDADGSGAGAKVLVAVLSGQPAMTAADIFVT